MHGRHIALLSAVMAIGCEAAPLQYQSSATFSATYGCDFAHIRAIQTAHRPGSDYEIFDVRGCGLRQVYYCAIDVGCVRPEEAGAEPNGAPATKLPPGLVDQTPQQPPVVAPDRENGS